QALPILWKHDEARARSLLSQIVSEFAQMSSIEKDEDQQFVSFEQIVQQTRQNIVQELSPLDSQAALDFLRATRDYARIGSSEQEKQLEVQLQMSAIAHLANRNPRQALEVAQRSLRQADALPYETVNVMSTLMASDPAAASALFSDLLAKLKQAG